MREDSLAWRDGEKRTAASDGFGGRCVAGVGVVEIGFDKGGAEVLRLGVGDERADFRPCALCADEEIGRYGCAVGEGEFVAAIAE